MERSGNATWPVPPQQSGLALREPNEIKGSRGVANDNEGKTEGSKWAGAHESIWKNERVSNHNIDLTSAPALLGVELCVCLVATILFLTVERPFLQLRHRIARREFAAARKGPG